MILTTWVLGTLLKKMSCHTFLEVCGDFKCIFPFIEIIIHEHKIWIQNNINARNTYIQEYGTIHYVINAEKFIKACT